MTSPAVARTPAFAGIAWRPFLFSVALAAGILGAWRDTYWRPFEDTTQESLVSFCAYGFAAASTTDLWPNPIVARYIDLPQGRVQAYPHWPNGFFLLLEGALRVFGRTEQAGRSVAVALTLAGFTLLVLSLERGGLLLYGTLPLILLSADGRDSIPFVFIDAALCLSIGVLIWITARLPHRPWLFRSALIAAVLLNHLVLPYAAVLLLLKCLERRPVQEILRDAATLAFAGVLVLAALAAEPGGLQAGLLEHLRIFQVNFRRPSEPWFGILAADLRRSLNLGAAGLPMVLAAWSVVLLARQWRTALLLPSFLLFAALLPHYVTIHRFARLPLVFFSLVTVAVSAGLLLEKLAGKVQPRRTALAQIALGAALAARLGSVPQQYGPDPHVIALRAALMRVTQDPGHSAVLERCNAFEVRPPQGHQYSYEYNPNERIGQFFFGFRVAEGRRRREPLRRCVVDLSDESVRQE